MSLTHEHNCSICGESYGYCYCGNPLASFPCNACRDHPWLNNLRLTLQMLNNEIKLPHNILECKECLRARDMQIKYGIETGEIVFDEFFAS